MSSAFGVLTVTTLRKSFNGRKALDGISFTVKPGEIYGLLGPNGAGKSTTVNVISAVIRPDEGTVSIDGMDLDKRPSECKSRIGVVPQEIALYNDLSAQDNLRFWGSLYGTGGRDLNNRIDETLRRVGLFERRKEKIKGYSGGMKRRINIAASLLHNPAVLIMDEPTAGVDPQSRNLIFEVVEQLNREGMSIVYTTHYMEEAERLCDRIGIIDEGRIVGEGSLEELRHNSNLKECISVSFTGNADGKSKMKDKPGRELVWRENVLNCFSSSARKELPELIMDCSQAGLEITHIEIKEVNLESIFLGLTGKQLRD